MKKSFFSIVLFFSTLYMSAQRIDGGSGHALLLCKNGEVFAVGENSYGQVGDTVLDTTWTYIKVPSLSDVVQVEAGCWHSMALKDDGSVWVWGGNDNGQLVDGTVTNRFQPKKVDSLGKVTQVSAGWWHSLFLLEDSTVWGGGSNSNGELGGQPPPHGFYRPHKVSGLTEVVKIAGGHGHSVVLKANGTIWTFGENGRGQLGNGSTGASSVPVNVGSLNNIIEIAAGWNNSYAIQNDGSLWAWGSNRVGQLGTGAPMGFSEYSSQPVKVLTLDSIVSVKTVGYSTIALRVNGTVWAWGNNSNGQLGDGTTIDRNSPVQVNGLKDIVEIGAASGVGMAIDEIGKVYTWGGVGFTLASDTVTQKLTPSPITAIACNPIISVPEVGVKKQPLEIYPNPTEGVVAFSSEGVLENVEVFNVAGISLQSVAQPGSVIDISELPNGIYFLKLKMEGEMLVRKILKQ